MKWPRKDTFLSNFLKEISGKIIVSLLAIYPGIDSK